MSGAPGGFNGGLRHPDEPLTRAHLLDVVWGYSVGGLDTVTVHVRRLREKIEADPRVRR